MIHTRIKRTCVTCWLKCGGYVQIMEISFRLHVNYFNLCQHLPLLNVMIPIYAALSDLYHNLIRKCCLHIMAINIWVSLTSSTPGKQNAWSQYINIDKQLGWNISKASAKISPLEIRVKHVAWISLWFGFYVVIFDNF